MSTPHQHIDTSLTQLLTAEQAYHYRIIPVSFNDNSITFKSDTTDEQLDKELQVIFGKRIEIIKETSDTISYLLSANFRKSKRENSENISYTSDFLEKILITAQEMGSSDIHFEPFEFKCRIRFRLDGKLKEHFVIPKGEYPVIINKIKIRAGLDISEKRLPQDGRITMMTNHEDFDIRVSSLPTLHGEKIVLRLLSKDSGNIDLADLGFTENELRQFKESVKKPNGIILISGPTGSGKTTTLYATLKLLNNDTTNILTIEDPIEYTLEGVNQVQLKENIGLDFASTLRTFLRQDPDIIMVGEIRDVKTANMAIRAALTGHLVLSTIHTNSAWATISRLIDMGVAPFLIASTLNLSVAQRLVRQLCNHCKRKEELTPNIFPENYKPPKDLTHHYTAQGCHKCFQTGYKGRRAIYEILPVTTELTTLIKQNESEIEQYLQQHQIKTLAANAIALVANGTTSVEEVYSLLKS
jgi:type IV pilus assembly protein PilB